MNFKGIIGMCQRMHTLPGDRSNSAHFALGDIQGDRSKREHFVLGTLEVEKSGLQVHKLKLKCCKDLLLDI